MGTKLVYVAVAILAVLLIVASVHYSEPSKTSELLCGAGVQFSATVLGFLLSAWVAVDLFRRGQEKHEEELRHEHERREAERSQEQVARASEERMRLARQVAMSASALSHMLNINRAVAQTNTPDYNVFTTGNLAGTLAAIGRDADVPQAALLGGYLESRFDAIAQLDARFEAEFSATEGVLYVQVVRAHRFQDAFSRTARTLLGVTDCATRALFELETALTAALKADDVDGQWATIVEAFRSAVNGAIGAAI
jgi:hypothetical protein